VPVTDDLAAAQKQLHDLETKAKGDVLTAVKAMEQELQPLAGGGAPPPLPGMGPFTLPVARARVKGLFDAIESVDAAPTTQQMSAIATLEDQYENMVIEWYLIETNDLPPLNHQLQAAGLPEIKLPAAAEEE
jgi:hypothetical protein